LTEAARAEKVSAKSFCTIDEAQRHMAKDYPSLVVLEHDPPRINGMDISRAIRAQANDYELLVPVIMVARPEHQDTSTESGVTDWLIKPFTTAYARTKIRTALLRAASQLITKGGSAHGGEQRALPFALGLARPVSNDKFVGKTPGLQLLAPEATARKRWSKRLVSSDKSALLWMYGREIASFDTPKFSAKVGEI